MDKWLCIIITAILLGVPSTLPAISAADEDVIITEVVELHTEAYRLEAVVNLISEIEQNQAMIGIHVKGTTMLHGVVLFHVSGDGRAVNHFKQFIARLNKKSEI